MFPGFAALSALDRVFLFTGALGAVVLVVRMALLLAGGVLDDAEQGEDGDGFKILSIHGLSSFFMMFGLVGLALSRQSRMGSELSLMGALAAGLAAIWVIARVFRLAFRLQSSGNLQPQAAAGCSGTVYLTIPAGGIGCVTVRIGQRTREMDAVCASGIELPTGQPIRVLRVERSLAVVQPLSSKES
jgi:hypothetical protein